MKQTEKFLYHTAAYTMVISLLFFLFGKVLSINELSMSFSRYFTLIAFSLVLSGAEFVFTIDKLNKLLQHIIHYVVMCIAFAVVFLTVRNSDGKYTFNAASVFAAIVLFSVFYVLITFLVMLAKGKLSNIRKSKRIKNGEKSTYSPRFKADK